MVETILAVVLIGIVAAMTISPLMKKKFEMEQANQFKKSISTLANVIDKVRADMGYQMGCYYPEPGKDWSTRDMSECTDFLIQFKKELNVSKTCSGNSFSDGCIPDIKGVDTVDPPSGLSNCEGFNENNLKVSYSSYVLMDGTIIMPYSSASPLFAIDINGKKPPNKWGYDIFTLMLSGSPSRVKIVPGLCQPTETGGKSNSQMLQDAFK